MASYVKIWTTLLNNQQFLSLSMGQRGMYLQLILHAKNQRDDGSVCFPSVAGLGLACSCERSTASKNLSILKENSLLDYEIDAKKVLTITLPNYMEWQRLKVKDVLSRKRKSRGKLASLRPEQTRPEHTKVKDDIPYLEIIEDLNKTVGTNYKHTSEKTRSLIRARWNEGFTLKDFQLVHKTKAEEWLHDDDFRKYLRPETLYGPKFENYLNQDSRPGKSPKEELPPLSEEEIKEITEEVRKQA